MSNDELRRGLDLLRSKLNIIEAEMEQGKPPEQAVRAVEQAVSEVRANMWLLLTAEHADDYDSYLGKIRVRRAAEACEDILADLHAGTIPRHVAGTLRRVCTASEALRSMEGEWAR